MTDAERTSVAESLLAVIFSLRPDNGEAGQAWVLTVMTAALARSILASLGPAGDPSALLSLSHEQVVKAVTETQSKFFRDRLKVVQ